MCFVLRVAVEDLQLRAEPVGTETLSCKKNVSAGQKFPAIAYVFIRECGVDPVGTDFVCVICVQKFAIFDEITLKRI